MVGAVAVAVVALMLLSGSLHIAGLSSVSAVASAGAARVDIEGFDYEPAELRIGQQVRILVKNHDLPVHTFTIEELDIAVRLVSGSEKLIELPAAAAGRYEYICTVPGHDNMKGTLFVN